MTTKPGSLREDFAGGDGGGGDADGGDEEGREGGGDGEGEAGGGEEVGGCVPEEDGEDAAVGAGAGLEVAGAEEGGEGPGPAGLADDVVSVHGLILRSCADGERLRAARKFGVRKASAVGAMWKVSGSFGCAQDDRLMGGLEMVGSCATWSGA